MVDDHTRKEAEIPGSSMYDSKSQLDDDCVSENSFGSDFGDNATDEEDLITTDANIELDAPPEYPHDECPQSTSNVDLKSPPVMLQYAPEAALNTKFAGPPMCVVCNLSLAYRKGAISYPTCGLTCASKLSNVLQAPIISPNIIPEPQNRPQYTVIAPSSASSEISFSRKQVSVNRSQSQGKITMCEVCHVRPRVQKGGKTYPTCGLTCAAALKSSSSPSPNGNAAALEPLIASFQQVSLSESSDSYHSPHQPSRGHRYNSHGQARSHPGSARTHTATTGHHRPGQVRRPCIVCHVKSCRDDRYVTCGMKCTEKLCRQGNSNPRLCDYCHRRPKVPGYNQCGKTCRDNASTACLLCRCRPRFGRYHLCGKTCKRIATKRTPLILEAPPGHTTYMEAEKRFKNAWKGSTARPPIKKIFKIIENNSFLLPYDRYKKRIGHEVFRYHGTSRSCTLGSQGNTRLCSSNACALCSILRTSFRVSLANPSGAFGAGIYTSSAANKAYSYSNSGTGAVLVTKVVLGTVYNVQRWNQVMSCPQGYNSVVFDRANGTLNETIVYTDDAIRPVFLIMF